MNKELQEIERIQSDFLKNREDVENVKDWKLIMTEQEIDIIIQKIAHIINSKFEGKPIVLTGILKGCIYFFVKLSQYLIIPHSIYMIEASSYKNSQSQEDIEITSNINPSKFENKFVILIDELFDNGNTINSVKNIISKFVPIENIFSCVLFKKNKQSKYSVDLFGIILPDIWLVGYGLDDKQLKRNWTYMFGCPKENGIPKTNDDKIFDDVDFYLEMRNQIKKQLLVDLQ